MQRDIADLVEGEDVYMSKEGHEEYPGQAEFLEHGVVTRDSSTESTERDFIYIRWDNGHENCYRRNEFLTKEQYEKDFNRHKFKIVL